MAGTLRSYEMPNLVVSAKKRERADVQDDLFKKFGVEPIIPTLVEGKREEDRAKEVLDEFKKTETVFNIEKKDFINKVKEAIDKRVKPEGGETKLWEAVVEMYRQYDNEQEPEEKEKVFEFLKQSYESFMKSRTISSSNVVVVKKELNPQLKKTMEFTQEALQMGLYYLDTFMGMVATRLADRNVNIYFKNRMPLVTEGVESIQDYIRKNPFLGAPLLEMILSQHKVYEPNNPLFEDTELKQRVEDFFKKNIPKIKVKKTNLTLYPSDDESANSRIGVGVSVTVDPILVTTGNYLHRILIPAEDAGLVSNEKREWVFNVLDLAALSFIISDGSLGALTMAHAQIKRVRGCERFTLKQLLMSEEVRDVFAIYVAFQYQLASGGNAYAGRASTQGNARGTTFMLSAGLETRKQLALLVETAQYWFQDVYETANPTWWKIKEDIEAKKREKQRLQTTIPNQGIVVEAQLVQNQNIPWLDAVVKDPQFEYLQIPAQTYLRLSLEILQKEQFLRGIPEKILKHAN